jgi:hypothetical protein
MRKNFSEKKLHEKFCGRISARKKLHENAADEFQREKMHGNFAEEFQREKNRMKILRKNFSAEKIA